MRTLIVGAGATGGYLGAELAGAGRDVSFLVHPRTAARLHQQGLVMRHADSRTVTTDVRAVTVAELDRSYDIVVLAVRADGVRAAADDIAAAVQTSTVIVPVVNGMAHLELLEARFGAHRVCGGVAQVAMSLVDGVIAEVTPGASLQIGSLTDTPVRELDTVAAELTGGAATTTVADDIVAQMWRKFAFICTAAVLTCLLGDDVGAIATARGGPALIDQVLDEISAVALAEGGPSMPHILAGLRTAFIDGQLGHSAPSMFRDLSAGRPVETDIVAEMAARARTRGNKAPLLDAAVLRLGLHNQRLLRDG